MTKDPGVTAALNAAKTATALAEALDVTRAAISQWKRVPAERVLDVERITGVSRHVLRPDLYGPLLAEQGTAP